MKIKNGKIAEATEIEMYGYWLDRYSDLYDFRYFMHTCVYNGTKIVLKSGKPDSRWMKI